MRQETNLVEASEYATSVVVVLVFVGGSILVFGRTVLTDFGSARLTCLVVCGTSVPSRPGGEVECCVCPLRSGRSE